MDMATVTHIYTIDGKSYSTSEDVIAKLAELEGNEMISIRLSPAKTAYINPSCIVAMEVIQLA